MFHLKCLIGLFSKKSISENTKYPIFGNNAFLKCIILGFEHCSVH